MGATGEHGLMNMQNRRTILTGLVAGGVAATIPPALAGAAPVGSPQPDDAMLLELEKQIFEKHELETAHDDEIIRLFNIYDAELSRLKEDSKAGRSTMTRDEIWARVERMPETQEHERLVLLKHSIFCEKYQLIEQMQAIPALTPEGRRAKLLVLLNFNVDDEWRNRDDEVFDDVRLVRSLLIEFVGGEPAEQLRDQFRTGPHQVDGATV
jgi:hypothetical protein